MNLTKNTKSISYLEANADKIAEEVKTTHQPMVITQSGEASMVLLSVEDFEKSQETLAMLKILSQSRKDIQDKNTISAKKAFKELRARRGIK